jgi:hypothetical protein
VDKWNNNQKTKIMIWMMEEISSERSQQVGDPTTFTAYSQMHVPPAIWRPSPINLAVAHVPSRSHDQLLPERISSGSVIILS